MQNKIPQIYKLLLKEYGPQGWWPTTAFFLEKESRAYKIEDITSQSFTKCQKLLSSQADFGTGFAKKNQLSESRRFEIIVGAILTQNTSWKNVEKAIIELNKKALLSIEKILACNEKELAKAIKSSGYYNQKSSTVKRVAAFLNINKMSKLAKHKPKDLRKILLSIKGIGKETADSIILYSFEKLVFVIDAYTKRLAQRLNLTKSLDYDSLQRLFEKNLPKDVQMYKEYHALIVEHAKRFCKKKPECEKCVLKKYCKLDYL